MVCGGGWCAEGSMKMKWRNDKGACSLELSYTHVPPLSVGVGNLPAAMQAVEVMHFPPTKNKSLAQLVHEKAPAVRHAQLLHPEPRLHLQDFPSLSPPAFFPAVQLNGASQLPYFLPTLYRAFCGGHSLGWMQCFP
jgi:hypothetical protein